MRFDRLATLYIAQPLRLGSRPDAVPVLMYHSVSDDPQLELHPYYRTTVSPRVFAEQMAFLHREGYETRSPGELAASLLKGPAMHGKQVVITFDDGFLDFERHAASVLRQYGFTATVYLPTEFIGDTRRQFKDRDCLTWTEVRELHEAGFTFGSHTATHPQLYDLDWSSIEHEVESSKQTLECELGSAISSFAYPFAFPEADADFKRRFREVLREAGYQSGVCTTIGRVCPDADPLLFRRLPVNSEDDVELFAAKLNGAYDWLRVPQYWAKWAKNWTAKPGNSGAKPAVYSTPKAE
jgi:peptidoglycan/xylan/chitin deacetylase (PgdA/CDA1 family)